MAQQLDIDPQSIYRGIEGLNRNLEGFKIRMLPLSAHEGRRGSHEETQMRHGASGHFPKVARQ
jgi:hypothetical protein